MSQRDPIGDLCQEAIDARLFPGAAFAFSTKTGTRIGCLGTTSYDSHSSLVTTQTWFDLASLTKVITTTSVTMDFFQQGRLSLDDSIEDRPEISIRNLLLHNSGLPPYRNFHLEEPISMEIRKEIQNIQVEAAPGERVAYSCLGFVLLQQELERIGGMNLAELFQQRVSIPWGLDDLAYLSLDTKGTSQDNVAPTTLVETWRSHICPPERVQRGFLCGAVHDPIAFLQSGISGNAGLFGSVLSVASFAEIWLASIRDDLPLPFLAAPKVKLDLREWTTAQAGSRALGWDTWSPGCSVGERFSKLSFGHTGYTGTSIWIDPANEIFAVLLTNRVHPDDSASIVTFRQQFHNLVFELSS